LNLLAGEHCRERQLRKRDELLEIVAREPARIGEKLDDLALR